MQQTQVRAGSLPATAWLPAVALAWLIPGGGHFFLKKRGRAALLAVAITLMWIFGLLARGTLFQPQTGDILTTIIYTGGFLGNVAAGILYLITSALGYSQVDLAGHSYDYGTKFLVTAGLLNLLAIVDAYEIASGKKD